MKEAIEDFNKAEKIDPTNPHIFFNRAIAKRELKAYPDAIADLSKTIELNSLDFKAYQERGENWLSLKDTLKACEDFQKAVKLGPIEVEDEPFPLFCQ